jgi:adenosylcobinamide kinase/adenosylcobinamide-phosphate guanylyltransferase
LRNDACDARRLRRISLVTETVDIPLTLVLGGARSGKSRHAENLVMALPPPWVYVATAQADDAEMAARIAAHRARRGAGWRTIEEPHDVASVLAANDGTILIDCLTLWLSNRMLAGADMDDEIEALETGLDAGRQTGRQTGRDVRRNSKVLVSNEVGSGIVPDNALARRFRDLQGRLNQRLAARADRVVLMVAGLPLVVKETK